MSPLSAPRTEGAVEVAAPPAASRSASPGGPRRNGFARLGDLDAPEMARALGEMELFQAEFVAATRGLWTEALPFTGDCLYQWSRRWEYPYSWLHLPRESRGRLLDAGSGITFFPFFLERAGFRTACADLDPGLGDAFERANAATGASIEYRACPIERLAWPDRSFDAVACVSVLEHVRRRTDAIRELARVLEPGGRLVVTWDVSLSRDSKILWEDVAVLLASLEERFTPLYPLDLTRPADLLTTDRMRPAEAWRLPWRPHRNWLRRALGALRDGDPHRSLAVMGSAWAKRG